jgi:hypothetical protein
MAYTVQPEESTKPPMLTQAKLPSQGHPPTGSGAVLIVILNKRFLRSEGSGRAARSVAFFATQNRALGSLPRQTAPIPADLHRRSV